MMNSKITIHCKEIYFVVRAGNDGKDVSIFTIDEWKRVHEMLQSIDIHRQMADANKQPYLDADLQKAAYFYVCNLQNKCNVCNFKDIEAYACEGGEILHLVYKRLDSATAVTLNRFRRVLSVYYEDLLTAIERLE